MYENFLLFLSHDCWSEHVCFEFSLSSFFFCSWHCMLCLLEARSNMIFIEIAYVNYFFIVHFCFKEQPRATLRSFGCTASWDFGDGFAQLHFTAEKTEEKRGWVTRHLLHIGRFQRRVWFFLFKPMLLLLFLLNWYWDYFLNSFNNTEISYSFYSVSPSDNILEKYRSIS